MLKIFLMLMAPVFVALWACAEPLPREKHTATLDEASEAWSEYLHGPEFWDSDFDLDELGPTITCIPLQGRRGYFVGSLAYHNDSFGCAAVFTVRRGQVGKTWWIENCHCAVYSVRCVALSGPTHPLIELISNTGHGNGSVQFYSFEHERLRLTLETRAYDNHDDNMVLESKGVYEPGVLDRTYTDVNADGLDDIVLSGWALWTDEHIQREDEEPWQHRDPVRKAFAFNLASGKFDELVDWRLGPEVYHDEDTWRAIELAR